MDNRTTTRKVRDIAAVAPIVIALSGAACSSSPRTEAASPGADYSKAHVEVMDRLDDAAKLLDEFREKLPKAVTKQARCIVVVPAMVRGGFIVGARHGEGFATCRAPDTSDQATWSAPAPISVSGGSAGAQIGVESVDVLMLVQSDEGMKKLLRSKFELGADVSASAGPVGRGREAATDATMKAEVLSYTRSRGLFAGAELGGAVVKQDDDATRALYGASGPDFRTLLAGSVAPPDVASRRFVQVVRETMQ